MALNQPQASATSGCTYTGEFYVAGVEGPEWLMDRRFWSLHLIGPKGSYRFYLSQRHVNEQGVPLMGQRLQVTVQWCSFVSHELCFITKYEALGH
ncbi:hypothetical protein ACLUEY_08165 [Vreelandella aquamarina]